MGGTAESERREKPSYFAPPPTSVFPVVSPTETVLGLWSHPHQTVPAQILVPTPALRLCPHPSSLCPHPWGNSSFLQLQGSWLSYFSVLGFSALTSLV